MKRKEFMQVISGSLLIAGTTVGAGMLGIPLLTSKAGLLPAFCITIVAWVIMLWTGLLFLEATLWMPLGTNLLSMSKRFFGKGGRIFSGFMFLFLYYCLLVAYFAAGAPLLGSALHALFDIQLHGASLFALFGTIFALIIALGAKWIDRSNLILITGMVLSYFLLIGMGAPHINEKRMEFADWPLAVFALPILFSAFGYHNIIPSLCNYFKKEKRPLKLSIIIGTTIPLIIYLAWQWLVIGIIPKESVVSALEQGRPVTFALQGFTGNPWIFRIGQLFAFFAIVTSLLGISFSMVDFFADGLKMEREGSKRFLLSLMTFFPPFLFVCLNPRIFDRALGIAGGFGEGILNGLIPIGLVWIGRYHKGLRPSETDGGSGKMPLLFIAAIIVFVMVLELINLL